MTALIHVAVLTGVVLLVSKVVTGVRIKNTGAAVITALVFSVLNWAVGWLLSVVLGALLFLPAIFTLGLAFLLIPFGVNTLLLWATDKVIESFEITDLRALLISSGAITLANCAFHVAFHR